MLILVNNEFMDRIDNYYTSAFVYLLRKIKELVFVQDGEEFR